MKNVCSEESDPSASNSEFHSSPLDDPYNQSIGGTAPSEIPVPDHDTPELIQLYRTYRTKCLSGDGEGFLRDFPPEETVTPNGRIPASANDWDYIQTMNDILIGLQTRKAEWGRKKAANLIKISISRIAQELVLDRLSEIFKIVTGNYLEDIPTDLDSIAAEDNPAKSDITDLTSPPLEIEVAPSGNLEFEPRSSVKATMIEDEEPDEEEEEEEYGPSAEDKEMETQRERNGCKTVGFEDLGPEEFSQGLGKRARNLGEWSWGSLKGEELIEEKRKQKLAFQNSMRGDSPEALDRLLRHRRIINAILGSRKTRDRLERISQWLSIKIERDWPELRFGTKIFPKGNVLTLADLREARY